jgi:hypothetical protein
MKREKEAKELREFEDERRGYMNEEKSKVSIIGVIIIWTVRLMPREQKLIR